MLPRTLSPSFVFSIPSFTLFNTPSLPFFHSIPISHLHFILRRPMGKQVEKGKMVKQSRSKKQEFVGNGKVTPVQIAFIVDRYLSDNRYAQTRTAFRSEASDLISKSPVQEAPKSLLSLGAILEEYITLKETKVWVDQERCRLEQENLRVQNLLSGMQGVMNAYNSGGPPLPLPPPPVGSVPMSSQAEATVAGLAGYNPMYNTPAMMSTSRPSNNRKHPVDFSTPVMYHNTTKRKQSKCVSDGPAPSKKSRRSTQSKDVNSEENQQKSLITSAAQSSACDNARSTSPVQGCNNVAKCLFNQETPSPPSNSSFPKTPPRASSSQAEKSTSPLENHSTATSSKETTQTITSSNRTIISSETIRVSPNKQISYYSIEKNHTLTCSPLKTNSKRSNVKEHVKGRLDFGTCEMPVIPENQTPEGNNSTSESEKEGDILGLDFPNLDALGVDFNLSEFLYNFDLGSDGLDLSSNETLDDSSPDSHSGSPLTSENVETGTGQVTSEYTSTISEYRSEKDTSFVGTDTVAAMRSVTKRIRIVSPVKNTRQFGSGEPVQ
ncbi:hypothetical protein ABFS82_10G023400 [Erythranthe guttata]|uniref:mucin-17 n=1 Tax=Erythranthe guttata TaxID=4155 RepID=UPI00064E0DFC|nr:PREDICTED: mucin-17 [Erythranthe guttata]|eukprot:XP_012832085.1 PREDICTED: mucin-17 [Erythranthe guttata]